MLADSYDLGTWTLYCTSMNSVIIFTVHNGTVKRQGSMDTTGLQARSLQQTKPPHFPASASTPKALRCEGSPGLLQMAQHRLPVYTLGPKVGMTYILGAQGLPPVQLLHQTLEQGLGAILKALCIFMVYIYIYMRLKGSTISYQIGIHVYTIKLHGAFGLGIPRAC